jgi:hypothetical protein
MKPYMSELESKLFECFLKSADRYLEFGSGGSTCLAANSVAQSVTAIDSSSEWLNRVATYCSDNETNLKPTLILADIGPTGDGGWPTDRSTRETWPLYHGAIWKDQNSANNDLYLVDGRFRIACFMQIILHAESDAVIIIHDFRSREHYHVVREVAREVVSVEDLSVFIPMQGRIRKRAREILLAHEFDPQ